MQRGLELYTEKNKVPFDFDFCTTDAADADEVLQLAIFGEVIYG